MSGPKMAPERAAAKAAALAEWAAICRGEAEPDRMAAIAQRHGLHHGSMATFAKRAGLPTVAIPTVKDKVLAAWRDVCTGVAPLESIEDVAIRCGTSRQYLHRMALVAKLPSSMRDVKAARAAASGSDGGAGSRRSSAEAPPPPRCGLDPAEWPTAASFMGQIYRW